MKLFNKKEEKELSIKLNKEKTRMIFAIETGSKKTLAEINVLNLSQVLGLIDALNELSEKMIEEEVEELETEEVRIIK